MLDPFSLTRKRARGAAAVLTLFVFPMGEQSAHALPLTSATQSTPVRANVRQFGDWTLTCLRSALGSKTCILWLFAVDPASKQLRMGLTTAKSDQGPRLVVLAPANVVLASSITLTLDRKRSMTGSFAYCVPAGCRSAFPMNDTAAAAFGAAANVKARYVAGNPAQPVSLDIPISRFRAGFSAWAKQASVSGHASENETRPDPPR